MIRNISLKNRSVIFNWLVSYLVFLLIFGILSFLIYFNTSSIIEKDLNNANILLLNSIQNDIDKTFEEAQKISVEVFFNPQIQKLLNLKSEISDSEYYQINNTIQSFYLYKSSSKTIDDVYIMLKGINKVVSSWGIKDTYYFYQTSYTNDSEAYKAWMNEYDEKRADKYSLVFTGQNNKEHKILYMRALSQSNNRDLSNSVTISINEDKLVNQLIAVDKINKGTSFILHNDIIVTSSKPIKLPEKFHLPDEERGNALYTKIEGKKVVVSFITSNASGWKYVTVVPEEVFLAKVNRLKIITYSFIIICFSLGIGLMYYFLKKNYNPINKLLSILANEPNFMNSDMNTNEYILIENGLKKAIAEKIEAANRLEDQKLLLKNNFLEKLLKGSAQFEIPITEALHSYEIKFDSNYFCVILFYLDEAFGENEPANISQRDINFIFSNVIGELVSVHHRGLVIEVDNSMACLVNVNAERIKESKSDLLKAIKEAQQFLLKYFKLSYTVAVSNVNIGEENIGLAYKETLDIMNYKKVLGIRSTLFYGDINRVAQGNFYYPILKEQQLINVIKSGDYESARTIVDEIYKVNFKDNNITVDSAQCLMLNLVCTLIRTVNEISAQYKDNLLKDFDPINDLLPYKSAEELKHHLDKFLYSFCKYILRLNKNSSNWVVADVVPFIENNYQDINLSVAQIAEQFDVHPAYISKTFKDTTGDGLLEFIHRTRVEKSKLLMQENKNTGLEEISTLVGFSNYRSFSRVFKKYEGITPGKYKDILYHPQGKLY